jgi:probable HAF family extracellular repeat protein
MRLPRTLALSACLSFGLTSTAHAAPMFMGLGDLAGGDSVSEANGVSGDGLVVVGTSYNGVHDEAFRWTLAEGMVGLGDLPGGSVGSTGRAVSADGLVVVGASNPGWLRNQVLSSNIRSHGSLGAYSIRVTCRRTYG